MNYKRLLLLISVIAIWAGTALAEFIEVPSVTYPTSVPTISRTFTWSCEGKTFRWLIQIPRDLLDYSKSLKTKFLVSFRALTEYPCDVTYWLRDTTNRMFIQFLADRLSVAARRAGFDRIGTAQLVISFVQAIPYQTRLPQLPVQTLAEGGDCDCKSILAAALLDAMGYKVAFLVFSDHVAVGIAFYTWESPRVSPAWYWEWGGRRFYYAETTSPGWRIGELPEEFVSKKATVCPVN
jgi:hypothetical protein